MSHGSSKLTPGQQDWYQAKFGERYLVVQETPMRLSRRDRRRKPPRGQR